VRFSLARFREITGAYTTRMTVVGHSLRRRRFEQLHRLALRWPKTRFAYEGVSLGNEANKHETAADGARPLSFQFSHIHVENAWLVSLARAIKAFSFLVPFLPTSIAARPQDINKSLIRIT